MPGFPERENETACMKWFWKSNIVRQSVGLSAMGRKSTYEKRKRRRNLIIVCTVIILVVLALVLFWFWPNGNGGESENGETDLIVACRVSEHCPGCACKNVTRSFDEGRVVITVYFWIPHSYSESVTAEFNVSLTNGHTEYRREVYDLSGRSPDEHPTQLLRLPPNTDVVDLEVRIHTCS